MEDVPLESYLIYDCKVVNCIPDGSARRPGLNYCNGWDDFDNLGISVIGYYSSMNGNAAKTLTYETKELSTFKSWAATARFTHDWVIGFNSRNFGDRLLLANDIVINTDYDLLEEIRIAAGFSAGFTSAQVGSTDCLGELATANQESKGFSDALAPVMWQHGSRDEVISSCRHGVDVIHRLLKLGLTGQLVDPNTGDLLTLRHPAAARS